MKVDDIEFYGAEVYFPQDMKDFWSSIGFPESEGWKMHLDHCTLGHRSNMTLETLLSAYMNREEECELTIDAVGRYTLPKDKGEGEVIAFRVKNNRVVVDDYSMKGENNTFHITAFTKGDAKPKDSNEIRDWELMGEMKLSGRIKFWMKKREN